MIAMLSVHYPGHIFKQIVQCYMSPEIPKRNETIKEIGSIGYFDEGGGHAIFLFEFPETMAGEFTLTQSKRTAFISARAPGFSANIQLGQKVGEAIPTLMPMYP